MISNLQRWVVRGAGVLAVAGFLFLVARFWHPVHGLTVFFQLDGASDEYKIAAFRELPVYVHRDTGGYDGLYYAQIAQDPTLRHPELSRAIDNLAYRARRILPPALAWAIGLGQPSWIIHTYALLNVAAWLALALLWWRLLRVSDLRGWLAWAGVLFSAGALSSVRLALTDLVALTILAAALLAAERGRRRASCAILAAAGLSRETSLLAVTGWWKPPWVSLANLGRCAAVAAPLIAWLVYIRWRTGPADQGWANFDWPLAGFIEKWYDAILSAATLPERMLAWSTLLATAALTVQAAYFVMRLQPADPIWRIGAAYSAMMLCLGTAVWEGYPGAATRVLLPMNLVFNLLAHRARASLAWLLAGNATIFAGLLAMQDVPQNSREVAAGRAGGVACLVQFGEGWHGREQNKRHVWLWSTGRGRLEFEAWPKADAVVTLQFSLRSLAPRRVVAQQDGREIWSGDIGEKLSTHTAPVRLAAGRAAVTFSTDAPPSRIGADPRDLAFALYDARVKAAGR